MPSPATLLLRIESRLLKESDWFELIRLKRISESIRIVNCAQSITQQHGGAYLYVAALRKSSH